MECWPLLRFVDGVGRCRLSALLPKAKHHRGGAQRAASRLLRPGPRRVVGAWDVARRRLVALGRSYYFVEGTARRVASRPRAHGTCAGAQPRYLSQTRAIEGKNSLFLGAGPANNFMLLFVQRHWNSNSAVPQRVRGHVTVYHVPLYFNEKEIRTEEAVKSAQRSAANTESCQATAEYFALR